MNIKYLSVLDVDEVCSSVLEDLPPFRVCRGNPHVVGLSRALDFPRVAGPMSRLNGQGSLIEPEDLSLSSISGLDNHVSSGEKIEVFS
jgi:hypothetical protein